jgi:hypothetical protein
MTGRADLYGGCLADGCPCVWFEDRLTRPEIDDLPPVTDEPGRWR